MTVALRREGSGYSPQSLFCLFCLQSVSLPCRLRHSPPGQRTELTHYSLLTTHRTTGQVCWGGAQRKPQALVSLPWEKRAHWAPQRPVLTTLVFQVPTLYTPPYTQHTHTHSLLSRSCTGQSWPSDSATRHGSPCTIPLSFFLPQVGSGSPPGSQGPSIPGPALPVTCHVIPLRILNLSGLLYLLTRPEGLF